MSNLFVQFKVCYTQVSGPVQTTCSNTLPSIHTRHFSQTTVCTVCHNPTKDSVIYIYIYICVHAHALITILHFSPASCLTHNVLFVHVQYLRSICTVCIFLFKGLPFLYIAYLESKSVSRLVVYRLYCFTPLLYVCIQVAPWSCEARHFIPLYVHTCNGMTIKLNLT